MKYMFQKQFIPHTSYEQFISRLSFYRPVLQLPDNNECTLYNIIISGMTKKKNPTSNIRTDHTYRTLIIILCVINFLVRLPHIFLLPYNDSPVYYDAVLKILGNHFNPFIFYISYKPPILMLFTALLFTLFTPTIIISNLLIYFCSSFSLLFTYLLGKRLFEEKSAFLAALLLCLYPLFAAQSFIFNDATFLTFLTLMTMYAYFISHKPWYFFSAILLVLTKEPSIFILLFIGIYEVYKVKFLERKSLSYAIKQGLFYWLPITAFLLWMIINKTVFGFYLDPVNSQLFFGDRNFIETLQYAFLITFSHNGIWLIWPTIIAYVVIIISGTIPPVHRGRASIIILFISVYLFYIYFYFSSSFVPRYMLPLYPYLFLAGTATSTIFFAKNKFNLFFLFVCTMFICINFVHYYFLPIRYWGETDLNLFRVSTLYKKSLEYIRANYERPLIVTIPWLYQWDTPAFKNTKTQYDDGMYFWNILNEGDVELENIVQWAHSHSLYPIIFIDPSYIDGPNDPPVLNMYKVKIITIFDDTMNYYNYHTLYRIIEPTSQLINE